jgi:hypothetical protein
VTAVYDPLNVGGYEFCYPVNRKDFETIALQINGESRKHTWAPLKVQLVRDNQGQKLAESDSPWAGTSSALMFRPRAISVLKSMLLKYGELLPLDCDDADLVVYNVTCMVNALDEEASIIDRFRDGRIMHVRRHVFREALIRDVEIFKIPNLRVSSTFVGQRFVDLWKTAGLKGLQFARVWTFE